MANVENDLNWGQYMFYVLMLHKSNFCMHEVRSSDKPSMRISIEFRKRLQLHFDYRLQTLKELQKP